MSLLCKGTLTVHSWARQDVIAARNSCNSISASGRLVKRAFQGSRPALKKARQALPNSFKEHDPTAVQPSQDAEEPGAEDDMSHIWTVGQDQMHMQELYAAEMYTDATAVEEVYASAAASDALPSAKPAFTPTTKTSSTSELLEDVTASDYHASSRMAADGSIIFCDPIAQQGKAEDPAATLHEARLLSVDAAAAVAVFEGSDSSTSSKGGSDKGTSSKGGSGKGTSSRVAPHSGLEAQEAADYEARLAASEAGAAMMAANHMTLSSDDEGGDFEYSSTLYTPKQAASQDGKGKLSGSSKSKSKGSSKSTTSASSTQAVEGSNSSDGIASALQSSSSSNGNGVAANSAVRSPDAAGAAVTAAAEAPADTAAEDATVAAEDVIVAGPSCYLTYDLPAELQPVAKAVQVLISSESLDGSISSAGSDLDGSGSDLDADLSSGEIFLASRFPLAEPIEPESLALAVEMLAQRQQQEISGPKDLADLISEVELSHDVLEELAEVSDESVLGLGVTSSPKRGRPLGAQMYGPASHEDGSDWEQQLEMLNAALDRMMKSDQALTAEPLAWLSTQGSSDGEDGNTRQQGRSNSMDSSTAANIVAFIQELEQSRS